MSSVSNSNENDDFEAFSLAIEMSRLRSKKCFVTILGNTAKSPQIALIEIVFVVQKIV